MVDTYRCAGCGALNRVPPGRRGAPICGRCKRSLAEAAVPQDVDGEAFRRTVEAAPIPVLVDFWAPWCGPCQMAAPLVAKAAREHAGRLIVLKVNSDENPELSSRYRISGVPAFLVFRNGREAARQVGLPSPAAFASWVQSAVS